VNKTIEEEGLVTPKSTIAIRGEKRSICKNCGMPVVGIDKLDEWICDSKGCDGKGKGCILSSHFLLGNLKTNARTGVLYLDKDQVTSLYES
jgi:hypothetical protein